MILYHGTSDLLANEIIKTRKIKNICERSWKGEIRTQSGNNINIDTTDGYVYLTNKLSLAIYYGNCANMKQGKHSLEVFIFRINIDEKELLPDKDELKLNRINPLNVTAEESIKKCCCVSVDHSLDADNYIIEYVFVSLFDRSLRKLIMEKSNRRDDPPYLIDQFNQTFEWKKL